MQLTSEFIDHTRNAVIHILDSQLPDNYLFHCANHTLDVLDNVTQIGTYMKLNQHDLNILSLCALFHDIGYVERYTGHEKASVLMAADYLNDKQIDSQLIKTISKAILATKVPQEPYDIYSRILCDADLMHLTYLNYFEQMELMRKEWILTGIRVLDEKEFHMNSVQFFHSHSYHTSYGKAILEPKKKSNLERIKKKITEL